MTGRLTLLACALVLVTATCASAMPKAQMNMQGATPMMSMQMMPTGMMMMDSKASYLNAIRNNGFNNPTMMITRVGTPEDLRMMRMRMSTMPSMMPTKRMMRMNPVMMRNMYMMRRPVMRDDVYMMQQPMMGKKKMMRPMMQTTKAYPAMTEPHPGMQENMMRPHDITMMRAPMQAIPAMTEPHPGMANMAMHRNAGMMPMMPVMMHQQPMMMHDMYMMQQPMMMGNKKMMRPVMMRTMKAIPAMTEPHPGMANMTMHRTYGMMSMMPVMMHQQPMMMDDMQIIMMRPAMMRQPMMNNMYMMHHTPMMMDMQMMNQ
ncbi:MAG: hypothetical protein MI749_03670 [Desulfovibrionales bacterium]|nr:hypothetical protein [Desulfovibrionales bacterium]